MKLRCGGGLEIRSGGLDLNSVGSLVGDRRWHRGRNDGASLIGFDVCLLSD